MRAGGGWRAGRLYWFEGWSVQKGDEGVSDAFGIEYARERGPRGRSTQ